MNTLLFSDFSWSPLLFLFPLCVSPNSLIWNQFLCSSHASYSMVSSDLCHRKGWLSTYSRSIAYIYSYSSSLPLIQSCTNWSRFGCQTPTFLFQILLFLLSRSTSRTISFLGLFVPCSSLFLLFLLCQLFRLGLCQLHSISACLGNIYWFHSLSLSVLMCLTKSLIHSSYLIYYSLGS